MKLAQVQPTYYAKVALHLEGDFPAKKNRLRPNRGKGGYHYDRLTSKAIEDITTQATIQWGGRPPIAPTALTYEITVCNDAKDTDGIWTTTLDVLKKAGVIFDDAVKHFNPKETKLPTKVQGKQFIGGLVPITIDIIDITLEWEVQR